MIRPLVQYIFLNSLPFTILFTSQVMKEADVVLAIEKKHQQSSTPPSPVKHTSAPDRDREEPSDILGLTYADTKAQGSGSRQGQGQGPGQGVGQRRNKWENNMTVDRSSTNASDEAIRVSESAQMVAAKVARLQDEQRRLECWWSTKVPLHGQIGAIVMTTVMMTAALTATTMTITMRRRSYCVVMIMVKEPMPGLIERSPCCQIRVR